MAAAAPNLTFIDRICRACGAGFPGKASGMGAQPVALLLLARLSMPD
jgi:hypothetical protein